MSIFTGREGTMGCLLPSPQSFTKRFLIRYFNNFGEGFNFVYNHLGYITIYRPLSYPVNYLILITVNLNSNVYRNHLLCSTLNC